MLRTSAEFPVAGGGDGLYRSQATPRFRDRQRDRQQSPCGQISPLHVLVQGVFFQSLNT